MAFQGTAPDINVLITVPATDPKNNSRPLVATERRINPSWTISHLKTKLEPITGIPSSSQRLRTKAIDGTLIYLGEDNDNADNSLVGSPRYGLHKNSEIEVLDTRPVAARLDFSDVSAVEKYEMPVERYERLDDSVLAWKRRQKLGRFDPNVKSAEDLARERYQLDQQVVNDRGIAVDRRCRVGKEDTRRGVVRFVGEIEGLGGDREAGCVWVGVELDEPSGRNDGTAKVVVDDGQTQSRRIFTCKDGFGVFVRPEKVEVGDFPPYDDLLDEDMEEM